MMHPGSQGLWGGTEGTRTPSPFPAHVGAVPLPPVSVILSPRAVGSGP